MIPVIKDIADQSGLYIAYDNRVVFEGEIEFFAQMIVKEAATLCSNPADAQAMLDHFGIKAP